MWWLSVSDPESSSGLYSGSSSLEDSCGALYVLLGFQDINCGNSVVMGGSSGGKLCCNRSLSVHHPNSVSVLSWGLVSFSGSVASIET